MLEIRPVQEQELSVLAEVYDAAWRHTLAPFADSVYLASRSPAYHRERFAAELRKGASLYLAFQDEEPCGMLMLYPEESQLAKVYLLPEYQGMGIGKALVRFALDTLPGEEVFLWAMNHNHNARDFYRHMGFRPTGEEVMIDPKTGLTRIKYVFRKDVLR